MLVILSFGCDLTAVNFRGDSRGICNFRLKQLFRERYCGLGASAHQSLSWGEGMTARWSVLDVKECQVDVWRSFKDRFGIIDGCFCFAIAARPVG